MKQRTRNILADVLTGVCILTIIVFVATHFMSPPRPAWRSSLVLFGVACLVAARPVRGRPRWYTAED